MDILRQFAFLGIVIFLLACDEGKCQEKVKYLSAAASADTSGLVCDNGSKLEVEHKDNAVVATCRCPPPPVASASGSASAKPADTQ